jgi:hypothetical protein
MNTRDQFGNYLLLKKLTEDALGETFRAGRLGKQGVERVALLRVFNGQGLDGERLAQRIQQRAPLQAALKSPNLAQGIDLGQVRGVAYVAYDYVSGKWRSSSSRRDASIRRFRSTTRCSWRSASRSASPWRTRRGSATSASSTVS